MQQKKDKASLPQAVDTKSPKFEKYSRKLLEKFPVFSHRNTLFRNLVKLFVMHEAVSNMAFRCTAVRNMSFVLKIDCLKRILHFYSFYKITFKKLKDAVPAYIKVKNPDNLFSDVENLYPKDNDCIQIILKKLMSDEEIQQYISSLKEENKANKIAETQKKTKHHSITQSHNNLQITSYDDEVEYMSIGHMKFRIK